MTTPEKAVAEYWRLKPLIQRDPPGWDSPVNVQDWAPNAPGYSWAVAGRVDHCGLSMNTLLFNIGLRVNVDYPNCAWTPNARAWTDTRDPDDFSGIQAGDLLLYRDAGSSYSATHIGIALEDWDGSGVLSGEFNTTPDGMGREYVRTPGYLVAAGRPAYTTAPVEPSKPPAQPGPIIARWRAIGGQASAVGGLVGVGRPFLGGAVVQKCERGTIVWSARTGAWELYGAIGRRWWDGAAAHVGMPVGPEENGPAGGRQQRFVRGRILWHPTTGAHILIGDIGRAYDAAPAADREQLGALAAGEDIARAAAFTGGHIVWSPSRPAAVTVT